MQIEQAYGFEPLTDRPQRLYDIWDRWRGDRPMPSRREVMPEELRDLLRYIGLILVAPDPADCRYLISGTAVDMTCERSLKGMTIREIVALGRIESLAEIVGHYAEVIRSRKPNFSRGSMEYRERGYISYDRVLLPLSSDGQAVDHILCGFFYNLY